MTFELASRAFDFHGNIPSQYTAEGSGDYSPPLEWKNAPTNVETFVLIVEDLDAGVHPRTHWVLYNIRGYFRRLPEAIPVVEAIQQVAEQGINDFGTVGYQGPRPSNTAMHHYLFTLYALDDRLAFTQQASRNDLLEAMQGHVLAQAQLIGTYRRGGVSQ